MKLIVAVDSKWGIGKNNDLLFHLKADMRHFVEHTKGKTVIMGANTLRSFPNGMPLKGRTNIVLNPDGTQKDAYEKGYILAKSLENLFEILGEYDTSDAYVIGGAMMYHTMLPYCEEAVITKVEADGDASVFFDNLDELDNWVCVDESEPIDDNGYTIRFCTYQNLSPKVFFCDDEDITRSYKKTVTRDDYDYDYVDPTSPERTLENAKKLWYKYAFATALILLAISAIIMGIALGKYFSAKAEQNDEPSLELPIELSIDNCFEFLELKKILSDNANFGGSTYEVHIANKSMYTISNLYIKLSYSQIYYPPEIIEHSDEAFESSESFFIGYTNRLSYNFEIIEISGEITDGK